MMAPVWDVEWVVFREQVVGVVKAPNATVAERRAVERFGRQSVTRVQSKMSYDAGAMERIGLDPEDFD